MPGTVHPGVIPVVGMKLLLGAAVLGVAIQSTSTPLVIAHRGASAYRPEHTLAAYALAIDMGADVIEPDVVSTKDGVLVARHENEIGGTTDVADKFPGRRTTKTIDGKAVTGWFTEDFTLAEIKTLRARERLAFREHAYDGQFEVPTLEEVLALVERKSREAGRTVGVYPETKHPAYFRGIGLPLEERLAATLARHGLTSKTSAVFIQSFEADSLKRLRTITGARLVQLISDKADTTPARLAAIAQYADGIGPDMQLVVPVDADGRTRPPTTLVDDAHAAGLFVHVWTLRPEPQFLPASYDGDFDAEIRQFISLGVDGFFTDAPDMAARVTNASGIRPGAGRAGGSRVR
jgi:glycerophosphoryl diester phosphodiesterase